MKKTLAILLSAAMTVGLLSACGGGSTAAPAATTAAAAETTAAAAAAPAASEAAPDATEAPAADGWDFSKDKTVELAFATYMPEGDSSFTWATPLFEAIEERTQGTVKVKVYAGETLLKGTEIADGVKNGVADFGMVATAYGLGTFPITYMMELPGVEYGSAKANSYAFRDWINELQPAELSDYKVMLVYCSGPGLILTADKPIKTVADFSGTQIRANSTLGKALEAYGAVPVSLPSSETYEAMRQGIVQGYAGLAAACMSYHLDEVSKYCVINENYQTGFELLMNKNVWESLSEGQQKAIDECCNEIWETKACKFLGEVSEEGIDYLKNAGVEINEFSDEDKAKMLDLTRGVLDAYVAEQDAAGLDASGAIAKFQELLAKYKDIYPTND